MSDTKKLMDKVEMRNVLNTKLWDINIEISFHESKIADLKRTKQHILSSLKAIDMSEQIDTILNSNDTLIL